MAASSARAVRPADVQGRAERRGRLHAGPGGELRRQPVGARALAAEGDQAATAAITSSAVPRAISRP